LFNFQETVFDFSRNRPLFNSFEKAIFNFQETVFKFSRNRLFQEAVVNLRPRAATESTKGPRRACRAHSDSDPQPDSPSSPSERTRSSRSSSVSGPFAPLVSEPGHPAHPLFQSRDVTTGSDRHNTQTFPWLKAITLRSRLSDCI
jgi:hypothetical protein